MSSAAYREPGVYFEEIRDRFIPAPISNDDVIALVSEVPSSTPFREVFDLTGTTAVELSKDGVVTGSVVVKNREETLTFLGGTDYQLATVGTSAYGNNVSVARTILTATETFTLSSSDDVYELENGRGAHNIVVSTTVPAEEYLNLVDWVYDPYTNKLKALSTGSIPRDGTEITVEYDYGIEDGETVVVEYRYADAAYYEHFHTSEIEEVRARFGEAFDANNVPNPMTLAAEIIYGNGGSRTQIRCVPVNPYYTGSKTISSVADWQGAIESVQQGDTTMLLETSGNIDVQSYVVQHVRAAYNDSRPMIAFFGRDGVEEGATTRNSIRAYGSALNNENVVLVSTELADSIVYTRATFDGTEVAIGTQYLAGALCGILSDQRPEEGLTRKTLGGLYLKGRSENIILRTDTTYGLCVVEDAISSGAQRQPVEAGSSGVIRVRHGITTAFNDVNTAEISVMRAKYFMLKQLRVSLDRTVIGRPMAPNLDFAVAGAAADVLERMRLAYVIADYTNPEVTTDPTNPTRLFLRFSYFPNYPLNEILIQFRITSQGATLLNT